MADHSTALPTDIEALHALVSSVLAERDTAIAERDELAARNAMVGSYHLPLPGFGHVVREGRGYRWQPADWQWTT
jgi:hypothetical protein